MDAKAESINIAQVVPGNRFSPDHCLLTTFRRAIAHNQNLRVDAGEHGELLLLSSRGEYFADSPNLPELLQLHPDKCRISVLSKEERVPHVEEVGRNIDELMWQTAYFASGGRLIKDCHLDDVVQLERWPNLTRLPFTPNTTRILALFYKHPTSVYFAARLLKVPVEEMYQVYSAANAAGFACAINRKAEEPRLEPHRNQTLLSSLLNKLAGR